MTAKEYLEQAKAIDDLIRSREREYRELQKDAELLKAVNTSGISVKGGNVSDPMKVIDKIIALQNEITNEIKKLIDLKAEIRHRINRVYNPQFVALLTDRYITGLTLEQIAEKKDKSYETIKGWHGEALQIFRKENGMT